MRLSKRWSMRLSKRWSMRLSKRWSLMLVAALSAPRAAGAAGAGDPLADGSSARERVLAGAAATADPTAALGWNPACLNAAGGLLVHGHFSPLPEGGSLDSFGVAWPYGPGVLGGSLTRLGVGGISTFDRDGIPTGTADYGDLELAAGYALAVPGWPARRATENAPENPHAAKRALDFGAALRFRRQSLGAGSGTGIGLDVGVAFRPRADVALGMRARNLVAPALTIAEDVERLPRSFALGGAWTKSVAGRPLLLAGQAEVGGTEKPLAFGLEIPVASGLLARAGARGGDFRLGAGFAAGFVAIDYGLESHALGLVHAISISARIGQGAEEMEAQAREAADAERAAAVATAVATAREQTIASTVDSLRNRARATQDQESARAVWLALRAHRPADPEAKAALDSLTALVAQQAAAWRDSLQIREEKVQTALAAHMAAIDSLAVARRDLREREAMVAAQRNELIRLGMLRRAADALASGDGARVAAITDSLSAAYPGDPEVLALRGRLTPAGTDLLDPEHREQARRLYVEGMRLFNAGDYEGAIRYWEELLALDPGNRAVRLNLDEARARRGTVRPGTAR